MRHETRTVVPLSYWTIAELFRRSRVPLLADWLLLVLPVFVFLGSRSQLGWKGFKEEVTAFYHVLSTHASSRQVFLSTEPYTLAPPKKQRDFKKVSFK